MNFHSARRWPQTAHRFIWLLSLSLQTNISILHLLTKCLFSIEKALVEVFSGHCETLQRFVDSSTILPGARMHCRIQSRSLTPHVNPNNPPYISPSCPDPGDLKSSAVSTRSPIRSVSECPAPAPAVQFHNTHAGVDKFPLIEIYPPYTGSVRTLP